MVNTGTPGWVPVVPAVRGCRLRKVSVAEPIPVRGRNLLRRAAQPGDGAAAVGREGGAEAAGPPARGVGGGFASPVRPGAGSTHPSSFLMKLGEYCSLWSVIFFTESPPLFCKDTV